RTGSVGATVASDRPSFGLTRSRSMPSFFFQAEDGIRARTVTGVQTCALPISRTVVARPEVYVPPNAIGFAPDDEHGLDVRLEIRSEERRVGKECRCRRWPRSFKRQLKPWRLRSAPHFSRSRLARTTRRAKPQS